MNRWVAAADLDNDGHVDSIVAAYGLGSGSHWGSLHVYLGHGDGTFTTLEPLESENAHYDVAVADFDKDGNPDVAMANNEGAGFSVRMGNGDGTFGPETNYLGLDGWSVSVGDFNGDGNPDVLGMVGQVFLGDGSGDGVPDLVVSNYDSDDLSVLLGNGDGSTSARDSGNTGTRCRRNRHDVPLAPARDAY